MRQGVRRVLQAKQIKVTQVRSGIGKNKRQVAVLKALGLNRVSRSIVHKNSDSLLGMVNKVKHLVKVEEL